MIFYFKKLFGSFKFHNPFLKLNVKVVEEKKHKIVLYKHDCLRRKPCFIDIEFIPVMDRLCFYATESGLLLSMNSSARKSKDIIIGAIVPPAKMSNHHIGHSVDINIIYGGMGILSKELKVMLETDTIPEPVLKFINLVREDKDLRWGGDFSRPDVVHFDDNTNNKNPELWREIYKQLNT